MSSGPKKLGRATSHWPARKHTNDLSSTKPPLPLFAQQIRIGTWGCWRLIQRVRAKVSQRLCSRRYSTRPTDSLSHAVWRHRQWKTAASTNEEASSRQERSSWKAGQIRGGYVGGRGGWLPSEFGIGKNKQVHEAPTAAEQNMAGWGEGGWDGWETTTPVARNEGECRRSKSLDARAQGSEQAWEPAEIADGPLVARDSSARSQHARRLSAGQPV